MFCSGTGPFLSLTIILAQLDKFFLNDTVKRAKIAAMRIITIEGNEYACKAATKLLSTKDFASRVHIIDGLSTDADVLATVRELTADHVVKCFTGELYGSIMSCEGMPYVWGTLRQSLGLEAVPIVPELAGTVSVNSIHIYPCSHLIMFVGYSCGAVLCSCIRASETHDRRIQG